MKCAIVLLALVAVSQAAFTSRLQQRAQPILNDALAKIRSSGGRSSFRETEISNSIIASLQQQADTILAQIDSAVSTGQAVAASLVDQFQQTAAQLQAMGQQVHANASNILSNFLSSLGGVLGGLFGGAGKNGVIAQSIVDMVNQWNLEHHMTNALNSNMAQWIAGLVNQLGAGPMVQNAVAAIMGQDLADYIFSHFGKGEARGLFDGLSSVGSSLTAAAQQALAGVSATVSNIMEVASTNFQQLQTLAQNFAQEALAQATQTAQEAAAQFLAVLASYQHQVGALYDNVVAAVTSIVGSQ